LIIFERMADILDLDVQQDDAMSMEDEGEEVDNLIKLKERVVKRKGRGFHEPSPGRDIGETYDSIPAESDPDLEIPAQRSIEGWILIVTGVHEEAHEDDVHGKFSEFGDIKNLHLNLDRRTGFLKGYALVEYEKYNEAKEAKEQLDGTDLLGVRVRVDWAFNKKPLKTKHRRYKR